MLRFPKTTILSILILFSACASEGTHTPSRGESRAAQHSKADIGDICEGLFYGEGDFCDCWCPSPDPDCEAGLPLWEECEEPQVACDEDTPCATCAGPDCPTLECLDGVCVETAAVTCDDANPCSTCAGLDCPPLACRDGVCVIPQEEECDETTPCATCAGLDCPVLECVSGACVEVEPIACEDTIDCATCAGLDCPVLECLSGQCVEVASVECPDPSSPDVRYHGFLQEECDEQILCSNNEDVFNIAGCGCGCLFTL